MRRAPGGSWLRAATVGAALVGSRGCGPRGAAPREQDETADAPAIATAARAVERTYALTWGGAPLGWAVERDDGRRWQRREQVVVRRGDAVVASELELTITRGGDGAADSVALSRWQDGPVVRGRATAVDGGWRVELDGEAPVTVPAATPFELALAAAPWTGPFRGPVLLPGYGFAVADLTLVPDGDDEDDGDVGDDGAVGAVGARDGAPVARRALAGRAAAWTATLTIGGRPLVATIRYDADGAIREIRGADGVVASRTQAGALAAPPAPIEVVGGNPLAVEGLDAPGATATGPGAAPRRIWLPDASGPLPPALPGQRVTTSPDRPGWIVRFDAAAPADLAPPDTGETPDRSALAAALAHQVADELADDLGATALTQGGARDARRGDCTTHALRFAALAADAGLPTRLVTGLRLDGGALVRHRWVLAWTGTRWTPIDPTYGEAPAAPVLLGLAVHGARAADLALADAVVFDSLGTRAVALP
ncbi:MAG TPA: transglutaminase domain-containing protein [Kofleriaceae bacterium]|nr:transglutaminase domain-containing protein [Kofleriaceae bacterium]